MLKRNLKKTTRYISRSKEKIRFPLWNLWRIFGLVWWIISVLINNGGEKYDVKMSNVTAMKRPLDGFKIVSTKINAKEQTNAKLVVSFLGLPAFVTDEEIIKNFMAG